ncbi:MAG TPA: hypothetical protein VJB87_03265 [Candidatus Nanoarchaeia archaeon]|nr:hypothetical protein [Candidatus Nanoarchaeia archaeon]
MKPAALYKTTTTIYTIIGILGIIFTILGVAQKKYFFSIIMAAIAYIAFDNTFCTTRKKYYLKKKR